MLMLGDVLAPVDARALRAVAAARRDLRTLEATLVIRLRESGITWREIGELLGVRAQSAQRRFHAIDPRPTPRRRAPFGEC